MGLRAAMEFSTGLARYVLFGNKPFSVMIDSTRRDGRENERVCSYISILLRPLPLPSLTSDSYMVTHTLTHGHLARSKDQ